MSNCLGVNDTVGVTPHNHLHSYADNTMQFNLNANLTLTFNSNAATRLCDLKDAFTVESQTIHIDYEVTRLPAVFDQNQLANDTNLLWNNMIQKVNVAMLPENLDSLYKMIPFVDFKFKIGNSEQEPNKTRLNETWYLLVMQKECATVQTSVTTTMSDLLLS